MRPRKRPLSDPDTQCAQLRRLRRRAQAAEARAERAEADRDAAWARLSAVSEAMRAERAALGAFIDSPEWERDLLVLARERLRAAMLEQSAHRQNCRHCGGMGRGMMEGLLRGPIDALTAAHGLPAVPPLVPMDWPLRLGTTVARGRLLDGRWMAAED